MVLKTLQVVVVCSLGCVCLMAVLKDGPQSVLGDGLRECVESES